MSLLEVTGVLTPICTVLVAWLTLKNTKALKENTYLTKEVKNELGVVKTNTNGLTSELAATKLLLGEAVGNKAGREEQKAETEADRVRAIETPAPIYEVKVTNEPLKVTETPKKQP
jgi:hypothetical protein